MDGFNLTPKQRDRGRWGRTDRPRPWTPAENDAVLRAVLACPGEGVYLRTCLTLCRAVGREPKYLDLPGQPKGTAALLCHNVINNRLRDLVSGRGEFVMLPGPERDHEPVSYGEYRYLLEYWVKSNSAKRPDRLWPFCLRNAPPEGLSPEDYSRGHDRPPEGVALPNGVLEVDWHLVLLANVRVLVSTEAVTDEAFQAAREAVQKLTLTKPPVQDLT